MLFVLCETYFNNDDDTILVKINHIYRFSRETDKTEMIIYYIHIIFPSGQNR